MSGSTGKEFHQQLLNALRCAVVAFDSSGVVSFWNPFAERLLGWTAADIVGKPLTTILGDAEQAARFLELLPSDPEASDTVEFRCADGSRFVAHINRSAIVNAEGKTTGTVIMLDDPGSARKTAETHVHVSGHPLDLLLRRVLDTLPVGVWVADKDGQIILSNPAEQQIWGGAEDSSLDDYVQRKAWYVDTGRRLGREDWPLERAVRHGEVTLNEILEIESFGGQRKTILSSAAPIRDDQTGIIGGIAVNQDITEQRRIEQAERKHRTFANALSNITAMLTSSLDLQTVMERILDNVGRVVPHEAANIMLIEGTDVRIAFWRNYGPKCDEIFRTSRYSLDIPMLRQMLETGLPQLISDTHSAANWVTFQETAWIRSSVGVPIRSRDTILGFLTLDSSEADFFKPPDAERLRAFAYQAAIAIENARLFSTVREYASELENRVAQRTAELRGAKDHVEAILEHSSDGFALVTNEGVITQVNPSFRSLFGLDEPGADYPTLLDLVEPSGRSQLTSAFSDALVNGRSNRIELICSRLDGSSFDADVAIAPLFDPAKGTHFYICNVRDNTRQKTAERELRTALQQEKELSELKSRFVAMVSHEFRTPLASIQTSTDLLYSYYDRVGAERRNEIILRIQTEIRRLTALLEDVLTVAKADTVGLVLYVNTVDLKAFCADVIKDLSYTIAKKRNIALNVDGSPILADIDAKLFQQVLINLLSNAIKYSSEDSMIDLILEESDERIVLQVRDQGIGIPADDMSGLFDAFYRARNVGDRQGTGLGLAVVKRAVLAHHGTVAVESDLGVGTCFTISIPRRQSTPA